jgi:hypothetical protein
MNSRQRRKLAAEQHQKQRELQDELTALRAELGLKHKGVWINTWGMTLEQAVNKHRAVLCGKELTPKRDARLSVGLAAIMAMSMGSV